MEVWSSMSLRQKIGRLRFCASFTLLAGLCGTRIRALGHSCSRMLPKRLLPILATCLSMVIAAHLLGLDFSIPIVFPLADESSPREERQTTATSRTQAVSRKQKTSPSSKADLRATGHFREAATPPEIDDSGRRTWNSEFLR